MVEIFIVWGLGKQIAEIAKGKGRSPAGWVLLFLFLWISGEVLGAIFGVAATAGEGGLLVYVFALGGAVAGAVLAFTIVNSLSSLQSETGRDGAGRRRTWEAEAYGEKWGPSPRRESQDWPGTYRAEGPSQARRDTID